MQLGRAKCRAGGRGSPISRWLAADAGDGAAGAKDLTADLTKDVRKAEPQSTSLSVETLRSRFSRGRLRVLDVA